MKEEYVHVLRLLREMERADDGPNSSRRKSLMEEWRTASLEEVVEAVSPAIRPRVDTLVEESKGSGRVCVVRPQDIDEVGILLCSEVNIRGSWEIAFQVRGRRSRFFSSPAELRPPSATFHPEDTMRACVRRLEALGMSIVLVGRPLGDWSRLSAQGIEVYELNQIGELVNEGMFGDNPRQALSFIHQPVGFDMPYGVSCADIDKWILDNPKKYAEHKARQEERERRAALKLVRDGGEAAS